MDRSNRDVKGVFRGTAPLSTSFAASSPAASVIPSRAIPCRKTARSRAASASRTSSAPSHWAAAAARDRRGVP